MTERKIPNAEELLDQTVLKWEVATRLRWGMVAAMPETSFRLVLKKTTSLTPTIRNKEELQLEYNQVSGEALRCLSPLHLTDLAWPRARRP